MRRAVLHRRVFPYLAGVTLVLTVTSGIVVRLLAREDFPTVEDGIWWAVVTLATVGYGDIVPTTTWGRVVGTIVITLGVTFIAFVTATVTSYFVSVDRERETTRTDELRAASDEQMQDLLREIDRRLATIEAKLGAGSGP